MRCTIASPTPVPGKSFTECRRWNTPNKLFALGRIETDAVIRHEITQLTVILSFAADVNALCIVAFGSEFESVLDEIVHDDFEQAAGLQQRSFPDRSEFSSCRSGARSQWRFTSSGGER